MSCGERIEIPILLQHVVGNDLLLSDNRSKKALSAEAIPQENSKEGVPYDKDTPSFSFRA